MDPTNYNYCMKWQPARWRLFCWPVMLVQYEPTEHWVLLPVPFWCCCLFLPHSSCPVISEAPSLIEACFFLRSHVIFTHPVVCELKHAGVTACAGLRSCSLQAAKPIVIQLSSVCNTQMTWAAVYLPNSTYQPTTANEFTSAGHKQYIKPPATAVGHHRNNESSLKLLWPFQRTLFVPHQMAFWLTRPLSASRSRIHLFVYLCVRGKQMPPPTQSLYHRGLIHHNNKTGILMQPWGNQQLQTRTRRMQRKE